MRGEPQSRNGAVADSVASADSRRGLASLAAPDSLCDLECCQLGFPTEPNTTSHRTCSTFAGPRQDLCGGRLVTAVPTATSAAATDSALGELRLTYRRAVAGRKSTRRKSGNATESVHKKPGHLCPGRRYFNRYASAATNTADTTMVAWMLPKSSMISMPGLPHWRRQRTTLSMLCPPWGDGERWGVLKLISLGLRLVPGPA
jgi:hypothetical protein